MKNLIVIPTFNGADYVERLLTSMVMNADDFVLVVDTGSDLQNRNKLIELQKKFFLAKFVRTPFKGYITGALLWAYWNYPAENYLLIHDTIEIIDQSFINRFVSQLNDKIVVAWAGFDWGWEDERQKICNEYIYGEEKPERGIFGEIMCIARATLDYMYENNFLPTYPLHKDQAQGMERVWPLLFKKAGIEVNFLVQEWDEGKMQRGEFPLFKKTFLRRK